MTVVVIWHCSRKKSSALLGATCSLRAVSGTRPLLLTRLPELSLFSHLVLSLPLQVVQLSIMRRTVARGLLNAGMSFSFVKSTMPHPTWLHREALLCPSLAPDKA